MAFSVNKVVLVGNVTKDLELKYTPSQTAVVRLSIATNRSMKQQDGSYKDLPTFHNIVVFGKIAEWLSKNINKGSKVYVDGRIDNRSYQAQDGTTKYISEVVAENVIPMTGQKAQPTQQAKAQTPPQNDAMTTDAVDAFIADSFAEEQLPW